jgi:hypothetical protein
VGAGNFSLHHRVQNGSEAHSASSPLGPGTLSLGVKRPGREADHSSPSSAEVKNAWSYTFTPQYVFMAWYLFKHRDNFTFSLHSPRYPLERRLREPQSRSGRGGEEKNPCHCRDSNLGRPARSLVTILTELSSACGNHWHDKRRLILSRFTARNYALTVE